jgi:hypothetical protein
LPPLLQGDLSTDLDRLPPPDRPVTAADVGERLRLVFTLTTEIEQYDTGIHVGRLVLTPPDGTSRELDILQIGLGAAFAVSPDGAFAAKGRPGANAWEWEWQAELAEPILHALAVYRKKRPAEFVSLPLQLGGTAQ